MATTREKSTSIALVTWAAVSSERRMCSAMPRRMAVIGSPVSPGSVSAAGSGARGGGVGGGRGSPGGGGARAARPLLLPPPGQDEGEDAFFRPPAARAGAGYLG